MNITGIDLNLLPIFDALMIERSVTRAAERVGLSQPAVSNALSRLRGHFGDRLFVKARKAMVPTPRALELAPDIQDALARARSAFQRPAFRPETCVKTFRLATTDEVELALIPALIKKLNSVAPGISIGCTRLQGILRVPEVDLHSGALDGAIGLFPHPISVESGRFASELYRARYVCVARAGHPVLKSRLTLKQFCKLDHVVTYYPGEGPGLIDRLLAPKGYKRNIKLSLPHFLTVPFVVAGSDLIATVPAVVAKALCGALQLRSFKCPVAIPPLTVSLVWHSRTHEDSAHKWFRDFIVGTSRVIAGNLTKVSTRYVWPTCDPS